MRLHWTLLALTVTLFACGGDDETTKDTGGDGDADTDSDSDSDSDADSDTDADSDSDTDSDADTDPAFDHSGLAPDTQCQTCHEKDRDTPDHNEGWDCSPCHTPTAWDDRPVQHPIRTPHGVDEIVACADCHPSGPPAADCVTCHLPDKLSTQHYTVSPNPDPDDSQFPGTCIDACHPTGEL